MDDMQAKDAASAAVHGEENVEARNIGGKLHKAFMAEVGEEMCQAEVAHYANRCPQCFSSRPQKHIRLYKKVLALATTKQEESKQNTDEVDDRAWDVWGDDAQWRDPKKRITKPSDLDLYERRLMYSFAVDCGLLSPVVKLAEGPGFCFGARWALMQRHPWIVRCELMDLDDEAVKRFFGDWIDSEKAPWYVEEQYINENKKRLRTVSAKAGRRDIQHGTIKVADKDDIGADAEENDGDIGDDAGSTEDSDADASEKDNEEDMHVLKMLYRRDVSQVNRRQEHHRKGGIFSNRHNFYKHTRCTSVAQEEQSAFPSGALNVREDRDDENDFVGGELEIDKELLSLRFAQPWINQKGWDHASEQKAVSARTGKEVDLQLDTEDVANKMVLEAEGNRNKNAEVLTEATVHADYALDALDPTQRIFADRVLKWGDAIVKTYKSIEKDGKPRAVPKVRSWLCGSAGSGKSTT